jgi:hypothetical protein
MELPGYPWPARCPSAAGIVFAGDQALVPLQQCAWTDPGGDRS